MKKILIGFLVFSFMLLLSFMVSPAYAQQATELSTPTNKDQCKNDGWQTFNNPTFKNQGQCVSYVEPTLSQLTIIKHVINNNGGTAVAGDFTMSVVATDPSQVSFPGAEDPGTYITLQYGSYSVSESGPSGYAPSYSADCSGSIAKGEIKVCTITNDDIPPSLVLHKIVVNDNDGTADGSEWVLCAFGPSAICDNGPTATTNSFFSAGEYTLHETAGPPGYTPGNWVCVGGIQTLGNHITVGIGESAECTITNDDIAF